MKNETLILGIDPGYSGALAFLRPATHELVVFDMPLTKGKSGKDEVDLRKLNEIIEPDRAFSRFVAVIEQVHAMPNQGISSAFRFGEGYGALLMGITAHGYEVHKVIPANWKKAFGLSQDKGVSRGFASQQFPNEAKSFARVKDDGRAEASLIALYGERKILR